MKFMTIEMLRAHCRADSDLDTELTVYGNAAEAECQRQCGRYIFESESARTAAQNGAQSALEAALAVYNSEIEAAEAMTDSEISCAMKAAAEVKYSVAQSEFKKTIYGMIGGDDFTAACLQTAGHYFRNRENVAVGQTSTSVPQTAAYILAPYVYYGG